MVELGPRRQLKVELYAGLHEVFHVLAIHRGFATPREVHLPTLLDATETRLAIDVLWWVYVKALPYQLPTLLDLVRGPGHLEVINIDDQERIQFRVGVARRPLGT